MKLKKRLKGVADLKKGPREVLHGPISQQISRQVQRRMTPEQIDGLKRMDAAQVQNMSRAEAQRHSPEAADAIGMGYTGPETPGKGKKDGNCNVTACQMPLAGKLQFFMDGRPWSHTDERKYYCAKCEKHMTKWDKIDRPGQVPVFLYTPG
jgi:hypothetical protein